MKSRNAAIRVGMLCLLTGLLTQPATPQGGALNEPRNILFILQDKVTRFDDPGGTGLQVGTATGKINGVSITTFQFNFSGFPAFTFNNRLGITDTDGDQIIFRVLGSGNFLLSPLIDPTIPADATAPQTQVLGGIGGPVSGTYEVIATSGKYTKQYSLGEKFLFKAVGYNPNPASVGADPFGTTYVEVYSKQAR